jgi:hypothetical protein
VLKETPPVHHDLFEVITKAISSSVDSESEAINDLESKRPDNDEERAHMDAGETATVTTPPSSPFDSIFRQIIAAFSSMTPIQQIAMIVAIYFVAKVIFFRKNDLRDADNLAHKVDELANEIREMKVIFERILKMSERNYPELGDVGDSGEEGEKTEL